MHVANGDSLAVDILEIGSLGAGVTILYNLDGEVEQQTIYL
jgi:hypothetical protein